MASSNSIIWKCSPSTSTMSVFFPIWKGLRISSSLNSFRILAIPSKQTQGPKSPTSRPTFFIICIRSMIWKEFISPPKQKNIKIFNHPFSTQLHASDQAKFNNYQGKQKEHIIALYKNYQHPLQVSTSLRSNLMKAQLGMGMSPCQPTSIILTLNPIMIKSTSNPSSKTKMNLLDCSKNFKAQPDFQKNNQKYPINNKSI